MLRRPRRCARLALLNKHREGLRKRHDLSKKWKRKPKNSVSMRRHALLVKKQRKPSWLLNKSKKMKSKRINLLRLLKRPLRVPRQLLRTLQTTRRQLRVGSRSRQ